MSTVIVSNKHISGVLNHLKDNRIMISCGELEFTPSHDPDYNNEKLEELGQIFSDANTNGFNQVHPEEDRVFQKVFKFEKEIKISVIQAIKLCDSLELNSTDWLSFEESTAKKVLDQIRIRSTVFLEGYKEAFSEI